MLDRISKNAETDGLVAGKWSFLPGGEVFQLEDVLHTIRKPVGRDSVEPSLGHPIQETASQSSALHAL